MTRHYGLVKGIFALAIILSCVTFSTQKARAQEPDLIRTVFVIGNINGIFRYPLMAFTVNGNELILAETWRPLHHGIGPVGLAVDPVNERLFVTYESEGFVDAFDARDATPLRTIVLAGTNNLCGIDVRVGQGLLYVVNRALPTVYVFDTDTFARVDQWDLSIANGAWDLEIVENWEGRDVIFVTNAEREVHWFDLDAPHAELGTVYLTEYALAVTVDNSSGTPVLYTTSVGAHSAPGNPYLTQYDMATDTENQVFIGGEGRGVAVNPALGLVYVNVGGLPNTIRVYDTATLTEQDRQPLPGSSTDNEASVLNFGSTVKKESSSHPDGQLDATLEVTFSITLTNRHTVPISVLPMKDVYDTTQLQYVSSTIDPVDENDDGEIDWANLIDTIGHDLVENEEFTFEVTFLADPEVCENTVDGTNIAQMVGAIDSRDDPVDDAAGSFAYTIWCNCVTDEDCNDGIYCNGTESCVDRQCVSSGNPCPIDDGLWCTGEETLVCVEETKECGHTGNPCGDDGDMCNGDELCDEEADTCFHSEDPCTDDGLFCNGEEYCAPNKLDCQHTGDPCAEDEACNEEEDRCVSGDAPTGDDDEAGWPEGTVTGGCCGCGE